MKMLNKKFPSKYMADKNKNINTNTNAKFQKQRPRPRPEPEPKLKSQKQNKMQNAQICLYFRCVLRFQHQY
jgi:hypothetical protein